MDKIRLSLDPHHLQTRADVKECQNSYVFKIDMPGLKSEDIMVQVKEDIELIISWTMEGQGDSYMRKESWVGTYKRRFSLPKNADTEKITAVCKDGVLSVTVKKLPPPEPRSLR